MLLRWAASFEKLRYAALSHKFMSTTIILASHLLRACTYFIKIFAAPSSNNESFLQKYWMYFAAVGLLILLVLIIAVSGTPIMIGL